MYDFDSFGRQIAEIDSLVELWIKKLGLNYNNFAVLYSLASGLSTQKQISEKFYLPKQTVFNICKEYKEKGWIILNSSELDKREKIIQLTSEGKEHADIIFDASHAVAQKAFKTLGKKKTTQMFSLLSEFAQVYQQEIDKSIMKE